MAQTAIIADSQFLTRSGMVRICRESPAIDEVVEVSETAELDRALAEFPEALLILDYLSLERFSAPELRAIIARYPRIGVMVISGDEDRERVLSIIESGIHSFLSKHCSQEEIHSAVVAVSRQKKFFCNSILEIILEDKVEADNIKDCQPSELSDREFEILLKVLEGKPAKEIGEELFLSIHTVYTHRKNILRKLGVKNSSELMKYALKKGIMTPEGEVNT